MKRKFTAILTGSGPRHSVWLFRAHAHCSSLPRKPPEARREQELLEGLVHAETLPPGTCIGEEWHCTSKRLHSRRRTLVFCFVLFARQVLVLRGVRRVADPSSEPRRRIKKQWSQGLSWVCCVCALPTVC